MTQGIFMQPLLKAKIGPNNYELLEFVMGFVDERWEHKISSSIEQRLTDIVKEIEHLAIEIEDGEWEQETL